MPFYRYSRWDGTQDIFPLHEDERMRQLGDQLMSQGDVSAALRSLVQRGLRGQNGQTLSGIQDILQRLRQRRHGLMERYDLGSAVASVKEALDDIVRQELSGIDRRVEEVRRKAQGLGDAAPSPSDLPSSTGHHLVEVMERMAERHRQYLHDLPRDAAGVIQHLQGYEFMDAETKARFDELLRSLQQRVLDSHVKDLSRRLHGLQPRDMAGLKQMMRDLSQILQERMQGGQPDFQQFMQRHGRFFGPNPPASLDELIGQMQRQAAQMESLLRSMSPDQRQEIRDIMESVFRDPELRQEMVQLALRLERLHPAGRLSHGHPFQGDEPVTLDEALQLMEQLQNMEELERQLKRTQHGSSPSEVDAHLLGDLLGAETVQELEQLHKLAQRLEDAGYIRKLGNRYELTPKGMRNIGQKALQEIFTLIKRDRLGGHAIAQQGVGGERMEDTKTYEFGYPFEPDMHRTLMNAVQREGKGAPLQMQPQDFEVYRTRQLGQPSTVLMIDISLSMAMRGNFLAAKKVALALDNLIRAQFPRDLLYIVGFSTYARELKPEKLPYLSWDEADPYTNIQQGLAVSQKLLSRVSGGTKQIIMISDGEPTAHLEGGQLFLQYPPSPRTIRETLREVKRCTRQGIIINTFMLERNSYLMEFVDQMTRLNRGRVFYTSPERLGQYILVDYFTSRRRVLA